MTSVYKNRSESAPPDGEDVRGRLAELYPGAVALGVLPLCGPRCEIHFGRPCRHPGKVPTEPGWAAAAAARWADPDADADRWRERLADHLRGGGNIGWCGPRNVLVLDADTPEAVAYLERALEDAPVQNTKRGAHYVVRLLDGVTVRARAGVELAPGVMVDLRPGLAAQIVVEPSVHASGAEYTWRRNLPADLGELPEIPAGVLAAILAEPHEREATGNGGAGAGPIPAGKRNDTLHRIACAMRARGEAPEAILAELRRVNADRCRPGLGDEELRQIARSAERYEPGTPDPRPEIVLTGRQPDAIADDAVAALAMANEPDPELFSRAAEAVAVVRDEEGRPVIRTSTRYAVLDRLAAAATWWAVTKDGRKAAAPAEKLAGIVLARIARRGDVLPSLRGVTQSPVMLEDGAILDRPGYDPRSRLYYVPPAGFVLPTVPEKPTADEVRAAVALLSEELLGEFPFASSADRASAIACLLTLTLRKCISGCVPAFVVDAPAAGTGKGLLADVVAVVVTGEPAAKAAEPDSGSDDEMRKRITSLLREGRALVVLDNVERPLGSPALAAALTAEVWGDRMLGLNAMPGSLANSFSRSTT